MIFLPQNSTLAGPIDRLYDFVFWISLVSFVAVVVAFFVFIVKYHRVRNHPEKTPYIEGHTPSEIAVCIVLFVLGMVIFYWGWADYAKILAPTGSNPLEISVTGRQWQWEFEYVNGRKMINELVVPRDAPVKLVMSSSDVLHSFYVPNFRLKNDVIPNYYSALYFTAVRNGENQVFCAEYCGTAHSKMMATIKVVDPEEYRRWQASWELNRSLGISEARGEEKQAGEKKEGQVLSPVERGKQLFAVKGCNACHTVTGQPLVGPSWKGIFGQEALFADGTKQVRDENYLRQSIMEPQAKVVKGFQTVMPTYKGQLTDDEVNAMIAYIKSLQ